MKVPQYADACDKVYYVTQTFYYCFGVCLQWKRRGQNLTKMHFTDDIVLLTNNLADTKTILQQLQRAFAEVGLKINITETKLLTKGTPH